MPRLNLAMLVGDANDYSAANFADPSKASPVVHPAIQALLDGIGDRDDLVCHVLYGDRKAGEVTIRHDRSLRYVAIPYRPVQLPIMGLAYLARFVAIRRYLHHLQPDIVHAQGTEGELGVIAASLGFPAALTIHGNMAELARFYNARIGSFFWIAGKLENWTIPRVDTVLCNSSYTEKLVEPRARTVWRVPNAIHGDFFSPPRAKPPADTCHLLNVGVISSRKQQVELLRLATSLHQRGVRFTLTFVGHLGGDSYGEEFTRAVELATGYARFLGPKSPSELLSLFDEAHALVHFPVEESFGMVVPESLSRGLKFFGARVGGIPGIAEGLPGVDLFAPGDWNGLEDALARWINSGFQRPEGSQAAMRARYHPDVIASKHMEIYRTLLGAPSSNSSANL